jgi:ligand-binding sensor domain-containing protein
MKKHLLAIILFLAGIVSASAEIGEWRVYAAYHNATKVAEMGGRLYVLSDGGLYSYGPDDTSVETYDKADMLSDNGVLDIAVCPATGELVLVYENGNIDIIDSEGYCHNMPELKNKLLADKTINSVSVADGMVYVSTNSGIVLVDVSRRVFANYYNIGPVLSAIEHDGVIYASTATSVYRGDKTANLLDSSNWQQTEAAVSGELVAFGDDFYVIGSKEVHRILDKTAFTSVKVLSGTYTSHNVLGDKLYFFGAKTVASVDAGGKVATYAMTGVSHMLQKGSTYWAAGGKSGLVGMKFDNGEFVTTVEGVIPDSPVRNYCYKLNMLGDRLLVAGGSFDYNGIEREGTIMKYEDDRWTSFDEEGVLAVVAARDFKDITDIVQDPSDPEHHYASAACSGLYEFRDYKLENHYTYNNSPLTSILPNSSRPGFYTRITSLNFDKYKNLWMCNTECDTIIRVKKSDGGWKAFYFDEIAGYPTFDHTVFDSRGWAWINSRRSTPFGHHAGVFVFDTNGTLDDTSDDRHKFITSYNNQDGTHYAPDLFNCIAIDLNGAMWFGNSLGLFVSWNPADVFRQDFHLAQVKVPRNDGTNLADYLLSAVDVKCITVDGGNRKWIGTSGSGVYLVSADGIETIHHFTTDNSPLISDYIYSIAIDGQTGEVFIGTDRGLVSFMAEATDAEEKMDDDLLKVYPNPVRPDYLGPITVTGLMFNSNVKIVNAAGRLVYEGTSVGGEFTWDGRISSGKRAASGIYYVLATDEEGNEGAATKFLIVR